MPGKKIPSWPYPDKPFDRLPTVDSLLQQSGLKVQRLRLVLRGVPRWKCTDNTVRYDAAAAAAALEEWEDETETDDAPANDNADAPANDNADAPLPADPQQAMLILCQRATQQAMATMQRTLALQNDVIKAMGDPLKMGMQLVKETQQVLRGRLGKYDKQWDRMILVTEELQSTQAEREARQERERSRGAMLRESFATAKQYLPDVLSKFQLTREASMALDLALSVEPEHLEAFIDLGVLTAEKTVMARQLIEILKARRAERRAKEAKSDAKQEHSAASSAASAAAAANDNAAASEMPGAAAGHANGASA